MELLSYLVVSLLLNFLLGFLSIMLLVQSTARDKNPYNIVKGSAIYLAVIVMLSVSTTGWISLLASIVGSCGIFWIGEPRDVCRAWGRALGRIADLPRIQRINVVHENLLTFSDFLRLH
ncbi:MAG: hypothetical protein P4L53_05070 [Candidatus Obscuribacterales bacterium]|nr:hypothetical protein [Candidatus Obscuribacterales bacterium]